MSASETTDLILMAPREHFVQLVDEAFLERKTTTFPFVKSYIVDLLTHFLFSENLWNHQDASGKKRKKMLAEMLLSANQAEPGVRARTLKELGDHSLYVSGFFGDSLQRKIIDVDYYVNMGRTAYDSLAGSVEEDTFAALYREIAQKFIVFVDVLTIISSRSGLTESENLLRQVEVYSKTGSPHLGEALVAKGLLNWADKKPFKNRQ